MELKNMDRLPESVRKALVPYIKELTDVYDGDIISLFAYGSVTGTEYNPGESDINIALIVQDASVRALRKTVKIVRYGIRKGITAPLFLTRGYIEASLETFPMEFLGMKESGIVLYGEDVLSGIKVKDEDLRRECEYQIKGKLLTIRQAYLEQALSRKGLEKLIKVSVRAMVPVFRNVLRLKRGVSPGLARTEMLSELGEELSIDVSPFLKVLADGRTDGWIGGKNAEIFIDALLAQLDRLSGIVDAM